MTRRTYTRVEIIRLLSVDESFIQALEEEQLVIPEPGPEGPMYSDKAYERIRLANTLVRELGVNLPGTAIIVRMRERLTRLQQQLLETLQLMRKMAQEFEDERDSH